MTKKSYIISICIYLALLPLNAINMGSIGSPLKIVAFFPIAIALFSNSPIKLTSSLIWQFIFTLFATFSLIWTISLDASVERVVGYVLLFLLLFSAALFRFTQEDIQRIKHALVWSSRLTAVVVFLFAEYYQGRLWLRDTISEDPNYMCAYFAFGIIGALEIIVSNLKIKRKIFSFIELGVYLYIVFSSGSRGGLVAVIAGVIAFILFYRNSGAKTFVKKMVIIGLLTTIALLILNNLPDVLRERFTIEDVAKSGGTGRTELWEKAWNIFKESDLFRILFGYGTASAFTCYQKFFYGGGSVVHNMFLETLVELGMIGFFLYTASVFSFTKDAFKQKDKFAFCVIFCMVTLSLSTSIYTFKPYFNIMLFIIMSKNIVSKEEEKNIEEKRKYEVKYSGSCL